MENTFVYLSPYKEENYNEDMKLRVEELICAVEMEYKHVRQAFLPNWSVQNKLNKLLKMQKKFDILK